MKYHVYISQVDQEVYFIEAKTERAAIRKAERLWKQQHEPVCAAIEKEPEYKTSRNPGRNTK